MATRDLILRVLFFREGNSWIAQALERDVAAAGASVDDAKRAFELTLRGYITMATRRHEEPLVTLQPAPGLFWELWDRAATQHGSWERIPSIPAFMMPVVTHEPLPA